METAPVYRWASWGDLNAFFGLLLDNLTNLVLLWGILAGVGFPSDIYFRYMVPGTALGVLFGDLAYSWMAVSLARRTGRRDITAMPLGLDTPSTIGVGVAVLIPCFLGAKGAGMGVHEAGMVTWKVGMATMVFMGVIKTVMAFFGTAIQRLVPQSGLLGSLAGVGITLLGFLPLSHMYDLPLVGIAALGLVLYSLVARYRLPLGIPGAFAAVLVGTGLYYGLGAMGIGGHVVALPEFSPELSLPLPTLGAFEEMGQALRYLPFAIPFGLLTIVGGINVTESARCAGDDYNTRNILLVEAAATFVAGVFGGVVQTTPYIGHPAYKAMGARAAYTLACGLVVGLGGALGVVSSVVAAIPAAAVAPTLLFVGLAIGVQAFEVCPKKHYAAVVFALIPVIAELVRIALVSVLFDPGVSGFPKGTDGGRLLATASLLGHGFILTSMFWAASISLLLDGRVLAASAYLGVMGVMTAFGFMHSVLPGGNIYLPWELENPDLVVQLTLAYWGLAVVWVALSRGGKPQREEAA